MDWNNWRALQKTKTVCRISCPVKSLITELCLGIKSILIYVMKQRRYYSKYWIVSFCLKRTRKCPSTKRFFLILNIFSSKSFLISFLFTSTKLWLQISLKTPSCYLKLYAFDKQHLFSSKCQCRCRCRTSLNSLRYYNFLRGA